MRHQGYKPDYLAVAVSRIIRANRRKLRYLIGSPLEKSAILLKKLLPSRLFEG